MCQFSSRCCACAGHIKDAASCAIHEAAIEIGIENIPADIGPIDYLRADLEVKKRTGQQ